MTDAKKAESQYTEVTTRTEYEGLHKQVIQLASLLEDLTAFMKMETEEKAGFTQHYQYMIISMNILASITESLIDRMAEKEGLDPTALRIELMERALKRIKENHEQWTGPMRKDLRTSDEFTAEAIQMKLTGLRKKSDKKVKP
jgi:hypothetical protein